MLMAAKACIHQHFYHIKDNAGNSYRLSLGAELHFRQIKLEDNEVVLRLNTRLVGFIACCPKNPQCAKTVAQTNSPRLFGVVVSNKLGAGKHIAQ